MTHSSHRRRRVTAGGLVALAACLLPAQAGGLTAEVIGERVEIGAVGLERNDITVERVSFRRVDIRENDPNGPRLFGRGSQCNRSDGDSRHLVCQADVLTRVTGDLGALDDRLIVAGGSALILQLSGGLGDDRLFGGHAVDRLDGGPGDDVMNPGGGADVVIGGPGDDLISTFLDGEPDEIHCAAFGQTGVDQDDGDSVQADLQDRFAQKGQCERITIAPVAVNPTVRLLAGSVRVGAAIRVDLACPAVLAAPCAGMLKATAVRGRAARLLTGLGRADYAIAPGRRRTVRIALTDRGRRVLDAAARLRLTSVEPGNELGPKTASITVTRQS